MKTNLSSQIKLERIPVATMRRKEILKEHLSQEKRKFTLAFLKMLQKEVIISQNM